MHPGGGGSSPIFVRGCATSGSQTPSFDKEHQRRKFDPVLRHNASKKCLIMYDSVDYQKILRLKLAKHTFFRGETSIFCKKGPFCKALLDPKRDPFVRQNFTCGPLCKAIFRQAIPSRHGPDFHRPQSQITIDSPDFHLRWSQNCLLGTCQVAQPRIPRIGRTPSWHMSNFPT